MKLLAISIFVLVGGQSYCDEDLSQDKFEKAPEMYRIRPIDEEELKKVQSLRTSEIYSDVLNESPPPSEWTEIRVMTLRQRPTELVLEIHKTLSEFPLTIDTLGKLPSLGSLVSPEFGAEVAYRVLEHPSSREFDTYFASSGLFRDYFRSQPVLLRSALDKMLSEGRIESDSVSHKDWEDSIDKYERLLARIDKGKPETQPVNDRSAHEGKPRNNDDNFGNMSASSAISCVIGGFVVIGILYLLVKSRE